jgi:hypothetical protein
MPGSGDLTAGGVERRDGVAQGRRRLRRPSGEAAALPHDAGWARWLWPSAAVLILGLILAGAMAVEPLPVDVSILRWAEGLRTSLDVDIAKGFNLLATPGTVLILRLGTLIVLAYFKRFRHLVVALVAWAALDLVVTSIRVTLDAPSSLTPPITSIATPMVRGFPVYYFPGAAMVALSITVFAMVYALVPAGRTRSRLRWAGVALLLMVACARILLAAAFPSAAFYSILLAATVAFVVFKWLCPDESFPVSYRRGGNAAHLDLGGERGRAVQSAMRDQLGIEVTDVKAFGDEGSGGSTPLLMKTENGSQLFGKILATSHLRADRWYRIGRTIMYGQLEDEAPFGSVRRLINYEDYALRLLDDDGFRVAKTYGAVELTPNREYLLPTEFFAGSETLGHAEMDDTVIDEGLALVRKLWDAGLAHRDIKPANLLKVDGHLQLIDVSGLEVRPSPWRQAVDLANMMLVMALKTDAERVYAIAQRYFSPEEVGEAFACAVGMAIPTELQRFMKQDGRDLIGAFKRLAPAYPAVSIQRWSARRIALTAAALVAMAFVVFAGIAALGSGLR